MSPDPKSPDPKSPETIFGEAIAIELREDRAAFLDQACQDDPDLRRELEKLVRDHFRAGDFLENPAVPDATIDQPLTEQPGTVIGRYKLKEQIGEGGMGVVYVAEQTEPVRRKVALKIIKPGMDTRQVIGRFEAERQALALMDHPNIARVLDAGATGSGKGDGSNLCEAPEGPSRQIGPVPLSAGRPYFVMELVRGMPITDYCDQAKLATDGRLELFSKVCQAVQHAHQKGIIHRDIKPSNVMVTLHDGVPVPKVIDFGVAKAINQRLTEESIYTHLTEMIGTPLYMSPEQAELSALDIDTRSDVYSLGVLLYELLTGTTPFDKATLREAGFDEIRRIIREQEPPRPSDRLGTVEAASLSTISEQRGIDPRKLTHTLRGDLDWIVMKALEKDRTRRYESASALAADLRCYLDDEPVQACPPSVGYRLRKYVRRNKLRFAMATVLTIAVLVATGSIGGSIGWMTRDRVARQARMSGQVELILGDVDRLIEQQKWPEAIATARRAEPLVVGDEAEEAIQTRVEQVLTDLKMVERLDEIRLLHSVVKQSGFDYDKQLGFACEQSVFDRKGTDQAYAAAFGEYGIDMDKLSEAEAGKKCRGHTRVAVPLVVALDHWALMRREIDESDNTRWRRLVAIAKLVDSDPLRNRLRDLWVKETTNDVKKELAEMAQAERLRDQPPTTLVFLAKALIRATLHEEAVSVLRRAQQAFPGDFWVNFILAYTINEQNPGDAESIRFFSAALALRPGNTAVLCNLGDVFKDQGKLGEAIACYSKALEIDPKCYRAHNRLGIVLKDQGKLDQAIACYGKAIEVDPKYPFAHYNLGQLFRGQGKLEEASECYKKAIEGDPKYWEAYNNLGSIFVKQGKWDEAIACCHKVIGIIPKFAWAYRDLGTVLHMQGKLDEAAPWYRKALELDPTSSAAHDNLGVILRIQGKTDEAIASFRKAIKGDPKYALAHNHLGLIFKNQGKPDEAIDCFKKAVEGDPKFGHAQVNLVYYARAQGRLDEAVTVLQKAIEVDPTSVEAYKRLAEVLSEQGNHEEAIEVLKKGIELDPTNADHRKRLADELADQGHHEEAIAVLKKGVELDPTNVDHRRHLADELNDQGRPEETIDILNKGIELDPQSHSCHRRLGDAHRALKQYDLALASYSRALEALPDYDTAYYMRTKVYCDQKKYDLALVDYRKKLEVDPTSHTYRYAVVLLLLNCSDPRFRDTAEALRLAREAVTLYPKRPTTWFVLGQAHYQGDDYEAAVKALEKSLELDYHRKAQSWFVLAMAHWKLGQEEKAHQAYRQAVAWMRENQPLGATFPQEQFRDEAASVLGVTEAPETEKNESTE